MFDNFHKKKQMYVSFCLFSSFGVSWAPKGPVFVHPGVYVFGCAYFRSAFKITYGLRLGSNDTTYASNSSKMRRNISCGTLTRGGSIANDRSIIMKSPAIVRSQSIVRSPTAISSEIQGPTFVKSPSTILF